MMWVNKCKITNTVTNKACYEGELHHEDMVRSDESLQVLDAKPKVLKRPHLKTHLEHDVKLPAYEESQTNYAKYHRAEVIENLKKPSKS